MWRSCTLPILAFAIGCTSLLDVDGFEYDTDPGSGGNTASGGSGGNGAGAAGVGGGTGGAPSGAGGSTGGAGGDGGATGGSGGFLDDFDRADDPDIGNGWLEKTPGTFGLSSDHIVKLQDGPGFNDNVVYRPEAEALLDVEASIEFELTSSTSDRPQLFVRGEWETITTPGGYVAYKVWSTGSTATLSRQQVSGGGSTLGTMSLSTLTVGTRYRLRLRATGTDPVQLHAWVEELTGPGVWTIIDETLQTDSDSARVTGAGVPGFAGNNGTAYVLDNYTYTAL